MAPDPSLYPQPDNGIALALIMIAIAVAAIAIILAPEDSK